MEGPSHGGNAMDKAASAGAELSRFFGVKLQSGALAKTLVIRSVRRQPCFPSSFLPLAPNAQKDAAYRCLENPVALAE